MTYARTDDNYFESPEIAALSDRAFRAHFKAWGYCARNLSDGFVPSSVAEPFGKREIAELVEHGVWVLVGTDGYILPDFLIVNDSREVVEARKQRDRIRKDSARNPSGIRSDTNGGESARIPGVEGFRKFKSVTTQPGVGSQKSQRQRLLLKAYEELPANVLYPNGEQLSDAAAIQAYLRQRNGRAEAHAGSREDG